jgi:hypothetical protein
MMIIGCDFHPSWQQVSWLDTETGDTGERKLVQASGDAERFYRQLPVPSLIGMEATGNCHWLVDLLAEIGHELWVGDAAQIRASCVRQQKTDQRDAEHILKASGRSPRIRLVASSVVTSSGRASYRKVGQTAADHPRCNPLLTFLKATPNISAVWTRPPNPWGKPFPITTSSARSAGGAWAWCTRRKT